MIITRSITWHVPTSLSLHTLSIEVGTRVSSIIQTKLGLLGGTHRMHPLAPDAT